MKEFLVIFSFAMIGLGASKLVKAIILKATPLRKYHRKRVLDEI